MAAPVAPLDEDWEDFNEFKAADSHSSWTAAPENSPQAQSFASFDETLSASFPSSSSACTSVSVSERELLRDDEIWNTLTENYGNVMPVDWKTSHTRSLHLPTLNLRPQERGEVNNLDVSDDEELRDQMDMHTIIISCVNEEPLFTAEQVIEEIEEIMQQSPDDEEHESPSQFDLSLMSHELHALTHSTSSSSYEERLRGLCVSELLESLEEVERQIRGFSEELIDQLAVREELDFEKEVKNTFISALIDVQNRQKEHRELLKKKRKIKATGGDQISNRSHVPGTYLTTVIPYGRSSGALSVEDLQILTKILHAMREDSDTVPALLTDYILKVLCPT
ncbi:fasciculation and elongation protein zeta-2-like isoform X1 [Sinocyclocheilus grahami]|uniref:Fasciculation and elongation protein zeta-2-like n=1 Tax=Sinocyclocheilus grahami TaxID=75366 RepID=A0A672RJH5_SINGR|nr:PREDICTED: fasciculation and elongation protein zeta-2-like isoform X1 [Sinocyclocheilus grahami]